MTRASSSGMLGDRNQTFQEAEMKLIVVASDGSNEAKGAVELAIELAKETHAAVAAVSVHHVRAGGKGVSPPVTEVEEPHGAEHIANATAEVIRDAGLEATAYALVGDPATEIARCASELGADLVVCGSRGYGAIQGALVGSVSRALMTKSKVPVTIVTSRTREHARV
jgi:nucleotide-binding universal stress UspA family protein